MNGGIILKHGLGEHVFQTINNFVFVLFTILCVYPFYYLFIISLSNPQEAAKGTIVLLPVGFTLNNYQKIFELKGIAGAFFISASRAVVGTMITVFFSAMFAYGLTKKETIGRKFMYRTAVISMYLNAGLIPWFITMKTLGLKNNYLLYILPGVISPFLLILIKTYIEQISPALEESAIIDGAGYFTIFTRIMLPVSKPVIAAVAVFSAVGQWNAWQDNFFLVGNKNLQTLQLILLNFLRESETLAQQLSQNSNNVNNATDSLANTKAVLTPFSVKTTITMVAAIPIICAYPMMQKYFVRGIMIGAIKG